MTGVLRQQRGDAVELVGETKLVPPINVSTNGAHAVLISTDGGLGIYDTTDNVTRTSDANLFATQLAS
jgi:hypothetical protein